MVLLETPDSSASPHAGLQEGLVTADRIPSLSPQSEHTLCLLLHYLPRTRALVAITKGSHNVAATVARFPFSNVKILNNKHAHSRVSLIW